MGFLPNPKNDPDYGRGIAPYDDEPELEAEPTECWWCETPLEGEYTNYNLKHVHHHCAAEFAAEIRKLSKEHTI